jgi:hypothetical protein
VALRIRLRLLLLNARTRVEEALREGEKPVAGPFPVCPKSRRRGFQMGKVTNCLIHGAFAALLGVVSSHVAEAQVADERSVLTTSEPVDVGSVTLPPGTYLIRVVSLLDDRSMVQVTNVERSKVFASVLATPHPILASEEIPSSRYIYYVTAAGQPKALRTWFAPDTGIGQDIVYPRRRALELAAAAKTPVIAAPDEVKEAEYKTAPLSVVTAEQQVTPYTAPEKAPAPAPVVVAEAQPRELPKTASHVPLFAALGLLSLGGAFGLRTFANRPS